MGEVSASYEFMLVVGKGANVGTLVKEAWLKARSFFGVDDFDLQVDVQGRSAQWEVNVTATRLMGEPGVGVE